MTNYVDSSQDKMSSYKMSRMLQGIVLFSFIEGYQKKVFFSFVGGGYRTPIRSE